MAYTQEIIHKAKRLEAHQLEALASPKRVGFDRRTTGGRRDWLVLQLLRQAGLRCVEITRLTAGSVSAQPDGSALLTIRGKGGRVRLALVRNGTAADLLRWIKGRRLKAADPVFSSLDRHGNPTSRPITSGAVWHVVKRAGAAIGMPDLHPHRLRHSFISEAVDAGLPVGTVMSLAGHSSMQTTSRYYSTSPSRMAAALGNLPSFMG